MTLDLLKKLVALANNNPNEAEANSAARRVCEALAECNFSLVPEKSRADSIYDVLARQKEAANQREASRYRRDVNDIAEAVRRAAQQKRQSRPAEPSHWVKTFGSWYSEYSVENEGVYYRCFQCKSISAFPSGTPTDQTHCLSCEYKRA